MTYNEDLTWSGKIRQFTEIKKKIRKILDVIGENRDDARALGIIHIRQVLNTLIMPTLFIHWNCEERGCKELVKQLFTFKEDRDLILFCSDFNPNSKNAAILEIQFSIENCMSSILEFINEDNVNISQGYWSKSKRLLELVALENLDYKHRVLNILAKMRNSSHRCGIYTQEFFSVKIGEETYSFEKNKRVEKANWEHIFNVLNAVLDILEEIFDSEKIKSVTLIPSNHFVE
jgi:hypothetical protein